MSERRHVGTWGDTRDVQGFGSLFEVKFAGFRIKAGRPFTRMTAPFTDTTAPSTNTADRFTDTTAPAARE